MRAVGCYLYTLRSERGYTRARVIEQLAGIIGRRVDNSTLWRIENGANKKADSDILSGLINVLGGSGEDVTRLANDMSATKADGQTAALQWLRRDQHERIEALVAGTPPEDLDAVIRELRIEYERNPGLLSHLRTFLAGWRGRDSAAPRQ